MPETMKPLDAALNSALRFAASRAAISAEQEREIWSAWNHRRPAQQSEPETWPDHLTGACLGFEGGLLNINRDGSGNLAFAENDLEWEQDDESGKDYRYVNIPKSEFDAIRDFLDKWFPRVNPPHTEPSDDEVEVVARALAWSRGQRFASDNGINPYDIRNVSCNAIDYDDARTALSTLQAKRDEREREAVVAWLRDRKNILVHHYPAVAREFADAIEAGQHHGGE